MNEQWQSYLQWSRLFRPIVFCAKCGSTNIDHKPAGRLTCFNCNNATHWSPDRFRIARDNRLLGDEAEFKQFVESTGRDWSAGMHASQEMAARESKDDFDWHADVVKSIEAFLTSMADVSAEVDTGSRLPKDAARIALLKAQFRDMADKIQATLESITPDSVSE